MSKSCSNISVLAFDFQQNLPIPVGEIFYLRQLWLYVFGIHCSVDNSASMYCWDETVAKKGANEVISCLNNYFSGVDKGVDTLFLYSDGCGGQNKNKYVVMYLYSLVKLGRYKKIRHIFPIRGHSFLPCDRDFGITEKKKRKTERIYIPDEWISLIKRARKHNPFDVVKVGQSIVFDYQTHLPQFFKNTAFTAIHMRDTHMFEYSHEHPDEVWIKYSYSDVEDWSRFTIQKPRSTITFPTQPITITPIPIKNTKLADLKKVVDKYVPPQYHPFYQSISSSHDSGNKSD